MDIPLDINQGNFPINYQGSPTEFFNDYRSRLRVTLPEDKVFVGKISATNPGYNAGPWLKINGTDPWVLYYWDKVRGGYYESYHDLGIGTFKTTLQIGSDAGPNDPTPGFFLPDATGTAATTLDVYVPRATRVETRTASALNFNSSTYDHVFHRLTRSTLYNIITLTEGQSMHFLVQNNGTAYDLTWSASVLWSGGADPSQPHALAGQTATAKYIVTRINSLLFGEYVGSYSSLPLSLVNEGGPDNNLNYNPSGHVGAGGGNLLP